jgi:hypothetical protein
MQDQTEDQPVLKHIQRLMAEEQQLHEQGGAGDNNLRTDLADPSLRSGWQLKVPWLKNE